MLTACHQARRNVACRWPWSSAVPRPAHLPLGFDWHAYLKWNPELQSAGVSSQRAAQDHYLTTGASQNLVYQDYNLTLRYTACGGLMNQHYCHLATLVLAHLCHAKRVIWPPMQERTSFNRRYHTSAEKNEQSWLYLDATSLWDMPAIQQSVQGADLGSRPDNLLSHGRAAIAGGIAANAAIVIFVYVCGNAGTTALPAL